jgi:DNA replication protein DnaC
LLKQAGQTKQPKLFGAKKESGRFFLRGCTDAQWQRIHQQRKDFNARKTGANGIIITGNSGTGKVSAASTMPRMPCRCSVAC